LWWANVFRLESLEENGVVIEEIYSGKKCSFSVQQLQPGTVYYFRIKAANEFGMD
jgi:phosphodiesterase/alkaline phosphatase D-like protein